MTANLKELVIVLAIGAIVLYIARPIALRFSAASDFNHRSAIWFTLTAAGFLCQNFWWFTLIAAPALFWGARKDSHPIAFYLFLLQVVPSIYVDIPVVGINKLFSLDIYRMLSLCVLIPAAWRLRRSAEPAARRLELPDILLLAFGALQVVFYVRPDLATQGDLSDSFTNALRRAFLYFLDFYIVYYAVSRYCRTRSSIVEAMVALCLCAAISAPIALFETLRHWLLYNDIAASWTTDPAARMYLMRDHVLRAQAASGDPLALGYLLATACGLWVYLWSHAGAAARKSVAIGTLWLGLLAAYSRGPWFGAVAIYLSYAAVAPQRLSNLFKTAGAMFILAVVLLLSPFGNKVIATLPFLGGSVDSGNYLYRQALLAQSWQLIQQHPLLGNRFAYSELGNLRQGQGIIDIVDTYVEVALFYGLIGVTLFFGFIATALLRAYRVARRCAATDPDLAKLGAALIACIVGTLLMLANCSFILTYAKLYFVLGGLAVAYARLDPLRQFATAGQSAAPAGPLAADSRLYPFRNARRI